MEIPEKAVMQATAGGGVKIEVEPNGDEDSGEG